MPLANKGAKTMTCQSKQCDENWSDEGLLATTRPKKTDITSHLTDVDMPKRVCPTRPCLRSPLRTIWHKASTTADIFTCEKTFSGPGIRTPPPLLALLCLNEHDSLSPCNPLCSHPQPEPAEGIRLAPPRLEAEPALRVRRRGYPRLVCPPQPPQHRHRRRQEPLHRGLVGGIPHRASAAGTAGIAGPVAIDVPTAQLRAALPGVQQAAGAAGGVVAEAQPRAAGALRLAAEAAPAEVALGVGWRDRLG